MDKRGLTPLLYGLLLCFSCGAFAETGDEEVPEMDFLEYLGMWEVSDEDWQLLNEEPLAGKDERSDPVPEGEESTETEDEG